MQILQPIDPNDRFRSRRRAARRARARRRLAVVGVVALAAAGSTLAARWTSGADPAAPAPSEAAPSSTAASAKAPAAAVEVPAEIRGVHVTMPLASLPGKLDEYARLARHGLNTIELDVKDEQGRIGFLWPRVGLARSIGAAQPFYRAPAVAERLESKGIYLIGRVVVFEDPFLAEARPALAVRTPGGGVWRGTAGLAWTNPYDRRVWKYNVDVAEAAVRAGFDEIMFDYVRFPTDGDVSAAVFNGRKQRTRSDAIAGFLAYAGERLKPLGARISAAVFGLAATRDLGIGQKPRELARLVDAVYPMVYPSHYGPGQYNLDDPSARPGPTVAFSLKDFRRKLAKSDAQLVPWLQDFSLGRTYTLDEVQAQIDAARRQHVDGFLLWNPEGLYTVEALAAQP
jgi:hypothetical protein